MMRETNARTPGWQLVGISRDEAIAVLSCRAAARRLWIAEQADYCAKWLKAQGLEVLRVEKGLRTPPLIHVRTSPLCDRFDGAAACYSRTLKAEQRYRMAMRHGCEVRWDEQEAHAQREVSLKLAYKKARSIFRRLLSWMGGAA